MPSYWKRERWKNEKAELAERFPQLSVQFDGGDGPAVLVGRLPVTSDVGYSVTIELPNSYPRGTPVLRCDPREVEPIAVRHVNTHSGEACLCVRSEIRKHWLVGSTISQFIDRLVLPFLDGQYYYDVNGHWPRDRGRAHGRDGILEAYCEMADRLGDRSNDTVERLMRLLARSGYPKGHELCPCGRGLKLRKCHRQILSELRNIVDPTHAAMDLRDCFPGKQNNAPFPKR